MFRVPPRAAPSAVPLRTASSLPAAAPPPDAPPPPVVSAVPQAASTTAATAANAVSDALVLLIDSSSSGRPTVGRTALLGLANGKNPWFHRHNRATDRDQRVMVGQWAAWRQRGAAASGPASSDPGPIAVASSASVVLTTRLTGWKSGRAGNCCHRTRSTTASLSARGAGDISSAKSGCSAEKQ